MFNGADEINEARSAAVPIFSLMARNPDIDSLATDGLKLRNITGNIVFDKVDFSYPTRKELPVRKWPRSTSTQSRWVLLIQEAGYNNAALLLVYKIFYPLDPQKLQSEHQCGPDDRSGRREWEREEHNFAASYAPLRPRWREYHSRWRESKESQPAMA